MVAYKQPLDSSDTKAFGLFYLVSKLEIVNKV